MTRNNSTNDSLFRADGSPRYVRFQARPNNHSARIVIEQTVARKKVFQKSVRVNGRPIDEAWDEAAGVWLELVDAPKNHALRIQFTKALSNFIDRYHVPVRMVLMVYDKKKV